MTNPSQTTGENAWTAEELEDKAAEHRKRVSSGRFTSDLHIAHIEIAELSAAFAQHLRAQPAALSDDRLTGQGSAEEIERVATAIRKESGMIAYTLEELAWSENIAEAAIAAMNPHHSTVAKLVGALAPFARMYAWLCALEEIGDIDEIKGDAVVMQVQGGGGTEQLRISHFVDASVAYKATLAEHRARGEGGGL